MDLKKRAGDVSDAQLVFFQDLAGAIDLIGVQFGYILVPHAANLDPLQAEVIGGHRAGMIEVSGNLIVNDGEAKWTGGGRSPHRARQCCQRTCARQSGKKLPAR